MAFSRNIIASFIKAGALAATTVLSTMGVNTVAAAAETSTEVKNVLPKQAANYLPTNSKLNQADNTPLKEIKERFAAPGTDFASGPLWVWNDLLTEEQIRSTLADLNSQHVNQAFVHPRPGLATPYLSDEWFKLWNVALDEAEKRGMKIWIYDENSYPSGFAGGYVPDSFPESRGSGLDVVFYDELVDTQGVWTAGEAVLYVIELLADQKTTIDRTAEVLKAKESGKTIPAKSDASSRWIVGRKQLAGTSQWYGGKTYVNLLASGVLERFLGFTHEAYRSHFGDQFGKLIPGAFTDEPQIAPAGMLSWCDDFAEEFQKRCGYDIVPNIGSLVAPVGNWKKVRYDYYKTALDLLNDRWHRPFGGYCESVGLEYTGHDWEHDWPNAHSVPDSMATAFWRQRPTIDLLMNQFSRGMHSQFGNVRSVRELNSVAHQSGRSRTLSENYGAGGYDICFADLKRLGDWSYALGVNMTDEHLSYISIRGARKHDHPQTFSYHSAWFEQYSKLEDYWTRLSYLLSRGRLTSDRFLLIEPTSTAWLYQSASGGEEGKKDQVGVEFTNLLNKLEEEQVDYDLGCEDIFQHIASVHRDEFVVGAARYKTVVLPSNLENLDQKTIKLLASFAQNGGQILSLGAKLSLVSGEEIANIDEKQTSLKKACEIVLNAQEETTVEELVRNSRRAQSVVLLPSSNAMNVFHQARKTDDAIILFVCNIDLEEKATGRIALNGEWKNAAIEVFDSKTGEIRPYNKPTFTLGPCESASFIFSKNQQKAPADADTPDAFVVTSQNLIDNNRLTSIKALDDNVLVLDYMSLKTPDKTIDDDYFYRVNGQFWNLKGFPMSPWDNGVQFKDELITKKFADETGFELTYKFNKSDDVVDDLRFVVENPGMFEVYCNDHKIEQIPNAWKFDRSFGVFNVAQAAKAGANEIRLVAPKSTIFTELMPAWLVGSFTLVPEKQGFRIAADRELTLNKPGKDGNLWTKASSALEEVSWLTSGVNFSNQNDRAPFIAFEFGQATPIDALYVWNYAEANHAHRGIKDFELSVLDANGQPIVVDGIAPGNYQLEAGDGSAQTIALPKTLELQPNWKLVMTIKSNWNGISYPLPEDFVGTTQPNNDNAFVGLSEIQFLAKDANGALVKTESLPKVSASSELVFRVHNRRAQYAVDGSGLYLQEVGWASQGRPFYAGRVNYVFSVPLDSLPQDRSIQFQLSKWRGAVATISVNDEQIGSIGWKDESVDLTDAIKAAKAQNKENLELTVGVYGTPKNLFGPHHAGQLRGSAWPGSFHSAPASQPSGSAYDVIEYGLFAE